MQGIPDMKVQDRVAAGFFLWMIYARARFNQMHKRHQQRMDRTDLFFSSGSQEQERYHVGDENEIWVWINTY